ncbi:hypothetical protein AVEN_205824-1 [Araneus ventricosus]|uniref:Uncharacterized protein n=1 Tax=Araneus ventricosus TaxID=182803 RepID=A0A4Y2E492_ARAVE|nr:hypothetical protein AVEN_205824-1 [Araneus ventricosus]
MAPVQTSQPWGCYVWGCLGGSGGGYLQRLVDRVKNIQITNNPKTYFSEKLYQSVDGRALSECAKTKNQNDWVKSRNRFLSGKDFINLIKTRINRLLQPQGAHVADQPRISIAVLAASGKKPSTIFPRPARGHMESESTDTML